MMCAYLLEVLVVKDPKNLIPASSSTLPLQPVQDVYVTSASICWWYKHGSGQSLLGKQGLLNSFYTTRARQCSARTRVVWLQHHHRCWLVCKGKASFDVFRTNTTCEGAVVGKDNKLHFVLPTYVEQPARHTRCRP